MGDELARTDLSVVFAGEGAEAELNGLYVARGAQHVDNHTAIDHAAPGCTSRQLYKGVLGGSARGVFNGKILVRRDAQRTDAKQTNKNLLLSEKASVDTKPQLEILADDVRCTHGAAVGPKQTPCFISAVVA
jgi:Fe-S cluster assembly protein SufD